MCLTVGYWLSTDNINIPSPTRMNILLLLTNARHCNMLFAFFNLVSLFYEDIVSQSNNKFFLVNCLLFSYFPLLFICLIISPQAKVIKWLRHKGLLRMKHNIQCCWDLSGYFREFSKRRINHERRALFQERLTWIISIFLNVSI